MPTLLLRASAVLLLWLLGGLLPATATHLVGGELTYRYLDANGSAAAPYHYEITARVYFNKEAGSAMPDGNTSITIMIYSRATGGARLLQVAVPRGSFAEITPTAVPGCPLLAPRVTLALYTTLVSLPPVAEGYKAVFTLGNRNAGIANLGNSAAESMTLSASMSPGTLPNSSPVFSDNAVALICLGETNLILNNAYDVDGDRLSYSFATPDGGAVNQSVGYASGYSALQPFGSAGYAAIDSNTGLATYLSPAQGTFLLAVDVQEFRTINGQEILLGTMRRDIQIVVRVCSGAPNRPPVFTAATLARQDYQVEEGQLLTFDIAATDPDIQPLTMNVGSVLLDGPAGIDATVNGLPGSGGAIGTVQVRGIGTVRGSLRLQAGCGLARPSPYDVVVTVADSACNRKAISGVFRITVNRAAAPARLQGDSIRCVQSTATYTATGPYRSYRWAARGGRVLGTATGNTAQVQWTTAGPGTVVVRGMSATGCPTDSVVRAVNVLAGPVVEGPLAYCRSANTGLRYTVAGADGPYQWTVTDGTLVSGQGTNTAVIDIPQGGTATLLVTNPATSCPTTLRVGPDNRCLYFYNVITPNGDGQNDVFTIENIERYPNTALTIFNRWGRKMYQSGDYHNTYGGEGSGPGLFYYLCQLADGTRYKGWFEVIR